jgi:hypothetical protein
MQCCIPSPCKRNVCRDDWDIYGRIRGPEPGRTVPHEAEKGPVTLVVPARMFTIVGQLTHHASPALDVDNHRKEHKSWTGRRTSMGLLAGSLFGSLKTRFRVSRQALAHGDPTLWGSRSAAWRKKSLRRACKSELLEHHQRQKVLCPQTRKVSVSTGTTLQLRYWRRSRTSHANPLGKEAKSIFVQATGREIGKQV